MRPRPLALLLLLLGSPTIGVAQTATESCVDTPAAEGAPIRMPITLINNHVYVQGCVAGRPLNLLVDTGAGSSRFELTVARELGVRPWASYETRGAGPRSVTGIRFDVVRVSVGGSSVPVHSAIDLRVVSLAEGHRIDGLLGHNFFAPWVVAIDYEARELTLHDPASFRYDGPGAVIPIASLDRNRPQIRAHVIVDGKARKMLAQVDLGAANALALTKPFVRKHALRARVTPSIRATMVGVGGAITGDAGRVDALRLGPYTLERPVAHLFGDSAGVFSSNHWDANIGGDVLRRFKVWFDYGRKQIILEPREIAEPFDIDMSGLRLHAQQRLDSVVIANVLPGSPAHEAGLHEGDVLAAVDEQPVNASTLVELRARLRRINESVTLTVLRSGERLTVRVTTRRLI